MTATCDRCGTEVDRVWELTRDEDTEWLCRDCHPKMG